MKVRLYSQVTVLVLGLSVMVLGAAYKPHRNWLVDCGGLILFISTSMGLPALRSQMRALTPIMQDLRRLCDFAGVPFGLVNAMYRWLWPFTFATLLLSIGFLVTAMILKAGILLRSVYSIFSILACLGIMAIVTRLRSVKSILRETHPAVIFGKLATTPPKTAKFILLLIPKCHREHLIGDLEEEYNTIVLPEYGVRKAQRWYWWQVAISVGPLLWVHIRRGAFLAWLWKRVR